ncbi:hypothetical protein MHEI_19950 [Mycobacterium heidelbergense]|nr:hypothetical protein MHEI_19950 [Mycobacterium heidelbergense]
MSCHNDAAVCANTPTSELYSKTDAQDDNIPKLTSRQLIASVLTSNSLDSLEINSSRDRNPSIAEWFARTRTKLSGMSSAAAN